MLGELALGEPDLQVDFAARLLDQAMTLGLGGLRMRASSAAISCLPRAFNASISPGSACSFLSISASCAAAAALVSFALTRSARICWPRLER